MPWLLACLLGALPAATAAVTVTAVEVRCDVPVPLEESLIDWVTVEVGDPLDSEAVAASLRSLHAAGVASQIDAYTEPHLDGVRLIFGLRARVLIEDVQWVGDLGTDLWRLRDATPIGVGDPFLADGVFRAVYALQDLMEAEGFLDASVRVEVDQAEARKRATVRFRFDSGPPSTVGEVGFAGEFGGLAPDELRRPLRMRRDERYRRRVARDDADRLEEWLVRKGFRQARVQPPQERRDGEARVDLVFPLELGPKFEVVAAGDAKRLEKEKLLPLKDEERYDDVTVSEATRALEIAYQQRGFYEAQVEIREEPGDELHRLIVDVAPGPRFELRRIRFEGNASLPRDRLLAVMQNAEGRLLDLGAGRLVDAWLENDLKSLRALYALEGFSRVRVGPAEIVKSGLELEVTIPVEEGPRSLVAELEFVGAEAIPAAELLDGLVLAEGGPYHPRLEEEALDQVRARYEAAGYDQARVRSERASAAEGTLVSLSFEIAEGPQSVVERVVVRGRQRTRPQVLARVIDLPPGTPLSRARLLELERRLYGMGVFSRVDVGLVPGTPYSSGRDVKIEVREGKSQRLTYGFGYDSEDGIRGLFGYSHANLWGRAMSGRIDLRISSRDRQARALLRQPYLGRFRLPTTYSLFSIEEEEPSFRSRRNGAQFEIERFAGDARWSLLATYRRVEIADADPALETLLVDRRFQEVTITSVSPSLTIDRRDDAVDPTRGWTATGLFEYAFPSLDADEEYGRLFVQHTRYLPLGRFGVVAGSARAGLLEPLGNEDQIDPVCAEFGLDSPSCRIKISERFFAGGRTTHRAYRRDRLGVFGETLLVVGDDEAPVPFGGTGLALVNLDYRFPIGGGVGGTLFVDAGNLWGDWRDASASDLKAGAGVGVRYASPIGPVRLEIGWKLDRAPGEDPYVVLFSFGNPF